MRALRRGFLATGTALLIALSTLTFASPAHAEETFSLSGTLTDASGPLGGLNTCADPINYDINTNPRRECVTSASDGSYTITGLLPGEYTLTAWGDGYPMRFFNTGGSTPNLADASIIRLAQSLAGQNITLMRAPALSPAPRPTVSGKAKPGAKLTAKPGDWAGATLSYQWLRAGTAIAGATKATYKVQPIDGGATLQVQVTGSKPDYSPTVRVSDATKVVPLSKLKSAKPKIAGKATIGKMLKVKPGKWTAGTKLVTQWLRGKTVVASGASYLVAPADLGQKLTVRVTGTKQGYKTVAKTSKATKRVK